MIRTPSVIVRENPSGLAIGGAVAALAVIGGAAWYFLRPKDAAAAESSSDGASDSSSETTSQAEQKPSAPAKESVDVPADYVSTFKASHAKYKGKPRKDVRLSDKDKAALQTFYRRMTGADGGGAAMVKYKGDLDTQIAGVAKEYGVDADTAAKWHFTFRSPMTLTAGKYTATIPINDANKLWAKKLLEEVPGSLRTEFNVKLKLPFK